MSAAIQHPYYRTTSFEASLAGETMRFVSKPGLPNWEHVSPAMQLLARNMVLSSDAKVLLLGCSHGALGVALARQVPQGIVWLSDLNGIALMMAEQTLQTNEVRNARVHADISVLPEQTAAFDVVVIELPKGRKLARRWLVEAFTALRPGGLLYLAGPGDEGIQPAINDMQALFGNAVTLGYKKRNRSASATRQSHNEALPDWSMEPGIAPGTWHEFTAQVERATFQLSSVPGIFAYDKVDEGTQLLLQHLSIPPHARVLDVGCGYGIIGLVAERRGAMQVDLLDVNTLSIAAARENIRRNGCANTRALLSDGLQMIHEQYDVVVSNPPFHVGKSIDYDIAHAFITDSRRVLEPDGTLLVVSNVFIRYEELMRSTFEKVYCIAENGQYRVLMAR
ncbi:MAG: methyltransferase [Chloroflexi bacterium AL-W]|nr:methyltransferase [Chloroflexi bacterium AL-N1]NOK68653.1 methyltransferase [Chloroflexi bacterium AL-N10]NOK76139.1 methyltransferase [Chloroflexi bacterium AL-N5]NOK84224.1 methyltransferase [Chloroflexi bacterium AL-W]NOK91277.1 methyltransferase [Chloroflexi bacterium AL-N15]